MRGATILILALLLATASVAAGCDDGESTSSGTEAEAGEEFGADLEGEGAEEGLSEEEREEAERAEAEEQISEPDRIAYYNIATATGLARIRAAAIARGAPIPRDADDRGVRLAAMTVHALAPENATLGRLQGRLDRVLMTVLTVETVADARTLLADVNAIERGLNRYAHQEPLIHVFVPD